MLFIETHHMALAFILVVAASLAAALSDWRTRRIPNALAVALFASGLAVNAIAGWQFALVDLAVTLAALVIGTVLFSLRLIGGGDIKLLAAACGALAFPAAAVFLLFTFVSGGIIAVAFAAWRGTLRQTVTNVRGLAMPLAAGVRPARLAQGTPMPYALAICAGALLTLVTNGSLPHVRF